MYAVGCVREQLWKKEELYKDAEQLLIRHVLPELSNESPFLKARACKTYEQFSDMEFKDKHHV